MCFEYDICFYLVSRSGLYRHNLGSLDGIIQSQKVVLLYRLPRLVNINQWISVTNLSKKAALLKIQRENIPHCFIRIILLFRVESC